MIPGGEKTPRPLWGGSHRQSHTELSVVLAWYRVPQAILSRCYYVREINLEMTREIRNGFDQTRCRCNVTATLEDETNPGSFRGRKLCRACGVRGPKGLQEVGKILRSLSLGSNDNCR